MLDVGAVRCGTVLYCTQRTNESINHVQDWKSISLNVLRIIVNQQGLFFFPCEQHKDRVHCDRIDSGKESIDCLRTQYGRLLSRIAIISSVDRGLKFSWRWLIRISWYSRIWKRSVSIPSFPPSYHKTRQFQNLDTRLDSTLSEWKILITEFTKNEWIESGPNTRCEESSINPVRIEPYCSVVSWEGSTCSPLF